MAELAMLVDIQWTVYPEEVTRQLHVMAQTRESSPVIDRRSNHCATSPTLYVVPSPNYADADSPTLYTMLCY